jgi:hypothetical protein
MARSPSGKRYQAYRESIEILETRKAVAYERKLGTHSKYINAGRDSAPFGSYRWRNLCLNLSKPDYRSKKAVTIKS